MQLDEAIRLIRHDDYKTDQPSKWADLGCGSGLFTHALASLQPPGSVIYAVDTNPVLPAGISTYQEVTIETVRQDFVQEHWPFDSLNGILMANSLHYVKYKATFLQKAIQYLSKTGYFIVVEYDTDAGNPWVPYPLSYASMRKLFSQINYTSIEKLGETPSLYSRANIYSSLVKL